MFGTHQIFGAMLKPTDNDDVEDIAKRLGKAKFACKIQSAKEDEE